MGSILWLMLLERQAQLQLNDARPVGRGDLPEIHRVQARRNTRVLCLAQYVLHVGFELEGPLFPKRKGSTRFRSIVLRRRKFMKLGLLVLSSGVDPIQYQASIREPGSFPLRRSASQFVEEVE